MRKGTCIHFRPLTAGNASRCSKGVNYVDAFKVPGRPVMQTAPCVTLAERFTWEGEGRARKLVAVLYPVQRDGALEKPCTLREFPTQGRLNSIAGSQEANVRAASGSMGRQWWKDDDE